MGEDTVFDHLPVTGETARSILHAFTAPQQAGSKKLTAPLNSPVGELRDTYILGLRDTLPIRE